MSLQSAYGRRHANWTFHNPGNCPAVLDDACLQVPQPPTFACTQICKGAALYI
ncbi:hypothetical protein GT037_003357 [Alternaria burnsii]|uniref:Uncharacterized protein n=1 Tax=Alternaria burnsii TaxID=1187904 RepID=A0A8H7BDL8_9PLEO|nr:uncharacterized protein GT037_003357 [Alternaria burnsii]KAF7679609.1 hypothetical protein GT037_003357 [Alternaria burnsii]